MNMLIVLRLLAKCLFRQAVISLLSEQHFFNGLLKRTISAYAKTGKWRLGFSASWVIIDQFRLISIFCLFGLDKQTNSAIIVLGLDKLSFIVNGNQNSEFGFPKIFRKWMRQNTSWTPFIYILAHLLYIISQSITFHIYFSLSTEPISNKHDTKHI